MDFDDRTGPRFDPPVDYPSTTVPAWWRDAKVGYFVHWGLYSLPAVARRAAEPVEPRHDYRDHAYAEWYANTMRIDGSLAQRYQASTYGVGTTYEDLADLWSPEPGAAADIVGFLCANGARYVVPTTKHHDGFCLWDTATTPFNAARRGPQRDLIAEMAAATRVHKARLGLYFSGALDWHVSDFPPIDSDAGMFSFRRQDEDFARYAAAQVDELVARFAPDIVWNDIDWPDTGKGHDDFAVAALWRRLLRANPAATVNDRWGVPARGFLTREYSVLDDISPDPWEATRGLGSSFGYNRREQPGDALSGDDLIRFLVRVVSLNGNLLINVGPDASGRLPATQRAAVEGLGRWLTGHGEAIYATRPWVRPGDESVRYTARDATVYLHVLDPARPVAWPAELPAQHARWLEDNAAVEVRDGLLCVPERQRGEPVAVARVGG